MGILEELLGGGVHCYYCKREFDSMQGLKAHLKHCQERGFSKRHYGWF